MSKGGWPHALYVGRLTIYDDSDLATRVVCRTTHNL